MLFESVAEVVVGGACGVDEVVVTTILSSHDTITVTVAESDSPIAFSIRVYINESLPQKFGLGWYIRESYGPIMILPLSGAEYVYIYMSGSPGMLSFTNGSITIGSAFLFVSTESSTSPKSIAKGAEVGVSVLSSNFEGSAVGAQPNVGSTVLTIGLDEGLPVVGTTGLDEGLPVVGRITGLLVGSFVGLSVTTGDPVGA